MTDSICVGIVSKPFGIKGQAKIHPYTSSPQFFLDNKVFFIKKPAAPLSTLTEITLQKPRIDKNEIITFIKGFADRTAIETILLQEIFIQKSQLPKLETDEYYLSDLANLDVFNSENQNIGQVLCALDYGAGAFLDIKLHTNQAATLPFSKISVQHIDLLEKKITIDETLLIV